MKKSEINNELFSGYALPQMATIEKVVLVIFKLVKSNFVEKH